MNGLKVIILVAVLFITMSLGIAKAETLSIDLARDHVDITTGFGGTTLILYGVKQREGELAVVLQGPEREMVVRHKDTVMGVWVNRSSMKFRRVPVYYDYALHIDTIKTLSSLERHQMGIGLSALRFTPDKRGESFKYIQGYQEALIRNKQAQGMFPVKAKKIKFLNDDFFRVDFHLPANVPTGDYLIKTFLFNNGEIASVKEMPVRVGQVGLGARIYEFAYFNSFVYGLICVSIAVFAGLAVNFIGRREA